MLLPALAMVLGVIVCSEHWLGTKNVFGDELWLHVAETGAAGVSGAEKVRWPLFLIHGLTVMVGFDPAHIRSRERRDALENYDVLDADGRRVRLVWHGPASPMFDLELVDEPADPERLAAALRGFLGHDPYQRPLVSLDSLIQEMVKVDGAV